MRSSARAGIGLVTTVMLLVGGTTAQRESYVNLGFGVFFCWNMSTFTHTQYSPYDLDPNTFAPTSGLPNFDQWLDAAKAAGAKYAGITTKHIDGFALWPTAYAHPLATNPAKRVPYSIAQTSWYAANGSPDLVALFVQKCRDRGLTPILYFSIWDETFSARSGLYATDNGAGTAGYLALIHQQLTELLSNYGSIAAILTDAWGWMPDVGFYTYITPATVAGWTTSLQPNTLLDDNICNQHDSHFDIWLFELSASCPMPAGNTAMAEGWEPMLLPISGTPQWFYEGGANDASTLYPVTTLGAHRLFANVNHSTYMISLGPDTSGDLPAAQVTLLKQLAAYGTFPNVVAVHP